MTLTKLRNWNLRQASFLSFTLALAATPFQCPWLNQEAPPRDYRQDMREFVQNIAGYAKATHPSFAVIPQNGQELLTQDGNSGGALATAYVAAIDGVGREDLFYGYTADDLATPPSDHDYLLGFMQRAHAQGLTVLVADYCSTPSKVDNSYAQNAALGFISFAANQRNLTSIPPYPATPYNVHSGDVTVLGQVKNFLYLLNPGEFASKAGFLGALQGTNYDLILIDAFFNGEQLTTSDIASLKTKANGGHRLVIAYMSIGEAEDYRYYWQSSWAAHPPAWLDAVNPNWPGNYKVRYWDPAWQAIIFGSQTAYLDRILAAGFDGVYLDIT
ncbi:MAG: endo alpha-1,4 polygalactosaminidase [Candidatus Hydrogenedentes bacterium]|nr:endo alpha-1,4 polygalactosaminidase [Candidatus Hydrogenedentota bacterium]